MAPFEPNAWYTIPVHNTVATHAWWLVYTPLPSPPVPGLLAWPTGGTA